jgi:hypothetical protein
MSPEISIFHETLSFDKASDFAREIVSPGTGSVLSASTSMDDSILKVSPSLVTGDVMGITEHALTIPMGDFRWKLNQGTLMMVPDGPTPHPEPVPLPGSGPPLHGLEITPPPIGPVHSVTFGDAAQPWTDEILKIELDGTHGDWWVQPDLSANTLNITFQGTKQTET